MRSAKSNRSNQQSDTRPPHYSWLLDPEAGSTQQYQAVLLNKKSLVACQTPISTVGYRLLHSFKRSDVETARNKQRQAPTEQDSNATYGKTNQLREPFLYREGKLNVIFASHNSAATHNTTQRISTLLQKIYSQTILQPVFECSADTLLIGSRLIESRYICADMNKHKSYAFLRYSVPSQMVTPQDEDRRRTLHRTSMNRM